MWGNFFFLLLSTPWFQVKLKKWTFICTRAGGMDSFGTGDRRVRGQRPSPRSRDGLPEGLRPPSPPPTLSPSLRHTHILTTDSRGRENDWRLIYTVWVCLSVYMCVCVWMERAWTAVHRHSRLLFSSVWFPSRDVVFIWVYMYCRGGDERLWNINVSFSIQCCCRCRVFTVSVCRPHAHAVEILCSRHLMNVLWFPLVLLFFFFLNTHTWSGMSHAK